MERRLLTLCGYWLAVGAVVCVGGLNAMKKEKETFQHKGIELVYKGKNQLMTQEKVAWLKDVILNQSATLSGMYDKTFGQKDFDLAYKKSELISFSQKNPLFFVHECSKDDCILSRSVLPRAREEYENVCVRSLARKSDFVDVGSGGFLTTLRILCKFFEKNPTAKITCHAIDPAYLVMLDKIKSEKAVMEIVDFDLETAEFLRGMLSDDEWQYCSWNEFFKQILSFIFTAYPNVTFKLFIYNSTMSFMKSAQGVMPSLVFGCDFDEVLVDGVFASPALLDYEYLVRAMAEKSRRSVKSILLLKPLKIKTKYDALNVKQPTLLVRTLKMQQGTVVEKVVSTTEFKSDQV